MLLGVCPLIRSVRCSTLQLSRILFVFSVSKVCAADVPLLLATLLIRIVQALQLRNANAQRNLFLLFQDLLIASSAFKANPLCQPQTNVDEEQRHIDCLQQLIPCNLPYDVHIFH